MSMEQGSTSLSTSDCNDSGNCTLQAKHKVFLSHSGAQKGFVEQLCVDLERCDRHPFYDKRRDCLPIGKDFPKLIFEAIEQCEVGVVVLSEEFFTSKWPMLELVAMANVKKRKSTFTILPILLGLSLVQCRDVDNHKRWLSLWHIWAKNDSRIDVEDWANSLKLFGSTNALKYNLDLGEVKFREEIVEAICKMVPPRTRFDDSHVQGRSRLCKVIHEKIKQSRVSSIHGVHVIGLYGVGGIGKTTLCKAMCNDFSKECGCKVAHVELGSQSEEDLLKDMLRRLTNMNLDYLGAMNVDEYHDHLKRNMMNVKVFLTIDNVSSATSKLAKTLLRVQYGPGSIVLVTTRSLDELLALRIDASECMEMPELGMEEAWSIFIFHVACILSTSLNIEDDHELIKSCVDRCYFKKGDGIGYHYHPLALQTLGEQLGSVGFDRERWWSLLHEIDFLNPFGEPQHPVFSILRRSFDALRPLDQLLFMDVALFAPYSHPFIVYPTFQWNIFEWFAMVHNVPMKSVIERLENLKRKSLLENLGDGLCKIGMHDLWREFARLETKAAKFEERRWMFEWDEYNALEDANVTNGNRLVNMKRMFFLDKGITKLKDVTFDCFPSLTVLKLCTDFSTLQRLNLRGLIHLKSLELECSPYIEVRSETLIFIKGLRFSLKLGFLRWLNISSYTIGFNEISDLTYLKVLDLDGCDQLPNLRNLILLEVACFRNCNSLTTITSLSSEHTNLQLLNLSYCKALQSCPGLGGLIALQELCLHCCYQLEEVPNLQNLKWLRKLDVSECVTLQSLPGLGDLVNLLELRADGCKSLVKLPNICKLRNLKILDLGFCVLINKLPDLNELVSLYSLDLRNCHDLYKLPNMQKLTNLQALMWDQHRPLQSIGELSNLLSLRHLIVAIDELHDGPDLRKLTKLETLYIVGWQGQEFSSLAELVMLETVSIYNCKGVRVLPHLKRLLRLRKLEFSKCEFEDLSSLINLTNLKQLKIKDCDKLEALPNLRELANLEDLEVKGCARLRDLRGILGLQNLKLLKANKHPWLHANLGLDLYKLTSLHSLHIFDCGFEDLLGLAACTKLDNLDCSQCPIQELPDLSNFPKLNWLKVQDCVNLKKLTCSGPSSPEFEHLNVEGCIRLQALPDLTNSLKMRYLNISKSGILLNTELIQEMKAHWPSITLVTYSWY